MKQYIFPVLFWLCSLTLIVYGIIIAINNKPLLGFIITVFGVLIHFLLDPCEKLFFKLFKK